MVSIGCLVVFIGSLLVSLGFLVLRKVMFYFGPFSRAFWGCVKQILGS